MGMANVGLGGLFIMLVMWLIGALILIAIIRYAIDSSKTSDKIDSLIDEIRMLRRELKEQDMKKQEHIIDRRV